MTGLSDGTKTPFCTLMPQPTSNASSIRPFSAESAEAGALSRQAARDELARNSGGERCVVRCEGSAGGPPLSSPRSERGT